MHFRGEGREKKKKNTDRRVGRGSFYLETVHGLTEVGHFSIVANGTTKRLTRYPSIISLSSVSNAILAIEGRASGWNVERDSKLRSVGRVRKNPARCTDRLLIRIYGGLIRGFD